MGMNGGVVVQPGENGPLPAETAYADQPEAALLPLLSVDTVIFSIVDAKLNVLLVKRAFISGRERSYPFQGRWALVGGLLDTTHDASLEDAALNRLQEKTNVRSPYLEQLQSFGDARRDPRKWAATVVYFALISAQDVRLQGGTSVEEVRWWPVDAAIRLNLGFDHNRILEVALERLRSKVEYTALPANLLPSHFTLSELQAIYEIILGRKLDKSSFRKRMLSADFLAEATRLREGRNRPAKLYRIKRGRNSAVFPRTFYS